MTLLAGACAEACPNMVAANIQAAAMLFRMTTSLAQHSGRDSVLCGRSHKDEHEMRT
jgi:hypothetical protein